MDQILEFLLPLPSLRAGPQDISTNYHIQSHRQLQESIWLLSSLLFIEDDPFSTPPIHIRFSRILNPNTSYFLECQILMHLNW